MAVIVVGHVVAVDYFDAAEILGLENSLEARNDQAEGEALLGTHGLAILAVAHQAVVHGFTQRNAGGAFNFLGALGDDPGGTALHAGFCK